VVADAARGVVANHKNVDRGIASLTPACENNVFDIYFIIFLTLIEKYPASNYLKILFRGWKYGWNFQNIM